MTTGGVVGREQELDAMHDTCLDRLIEGGRALVLEGEPGIGNSTVRLAAVAAARERGVLMLSARPAEAERGLAHAGLGDLLDGAVDGVRSRARVAAAARLGRLTGHSDNYFGGADADRMDVRAAVLFPNDELAARGAATPGVAVTRRRTRLQRDRS